MKKLIKWLRARLFARRWETMRKAAAYQDDRADTWDYKPKFRAGTSEDSIVGWPR